MKIDYREAALGEADRIMLDYVKVLTVTPAKTSEADVIRLRETGFSDAAILEINQVTGFFAWCNRIVDGLGVELEDFWTTDGASNV